MQSYSYSLSWLGSMMRSFKFISLNFKGNTYVCKIEVY